MTRMRDAAFLERLSRELPQWVERGWVSPRHQQAILDYAAQQRRAATRLPAVFALMGALLLGAGVITFFAANWSAIPKLAKLVLLFGALAASYAGAGLCFARKLEQAAQALALLGAILFGANIFLIAQIYHIDAHYPRGVLVWALGAFATALLLRSQAALILCIVLAFLWSALEILEFDRGPYFWFLLPWAATLPLIYAHRWIGALRAAMAAVWGWALVLLLDPTFMDRPWYAGERVALWQVYLFAGIAVYIVGRGMWWYPRWKALYSPVVTSGAMAAVVALFVLTFPAAQRFGERETFASLAPWPWALVTALVLLVVAALMVWRYRGTRLSALPLYRQGAFVWLFAGSTLALANLFMAGRHPGWVAFGYNVLALAGVVWLVMTGIDRKERRIVNLGFVLFLALLAARYSDTFWTLLDRSYFFMGGGALLIVAGVIIERSRRRLNAKLADASK